MRGFLDEDPDRDVREKLTASCDSIELTVALGDESATGKAVKIHDGTRELWLPKSLLRKRVDNADGRTSTITVPEWFAKKEGLI